MMSRALFAEELKIRGKGIWLLAVIGPIGLIGMQALNYGLRFDYLMKAYAADMWGGLLENIFSFVPIALILGAALLSSLLANVEHQHSSWKQLLALPISRTAVFSSKFVVLCILLCFSCALLFVGIIGLGLMLGMPVNEMPVYDILRISFAPLAGTLPLLAIQLWMSIHLKNQGIPVSIGVTAAIVSLFAIQLPDYAPLKWPLLAYQGPGQGKVIGAGLVLSALIGLAGAIHFHRKDVD
ncbi:ABC transporter permease [Paenibacillus sp. F411]|uniref:Permease n=1 Tax=Paenibacillus algicola TaxID=2565926 RepID=A0A4P8XFK8_9BACL|nr:MULTISPECIES: ABC transporter permease [Paenibacillus]MBO2945884.1 ABC transporter permease [Paenibacillus sp. F411]QCT01182.1 permease [Paenibacillus algicola]